MIRTRKDIDRIVDSPDKISSDSVIVSVLS
jgi:hypothetical protein